MSAPEFDWLEFAHDAGERTKDVERSKGAEAARANAAWAIEQEELERQLQNPERHALNRFWRALMLARDPETMEALLNGERVPIDRLDPDWVERFGLRRG